MKLIVKLVKWLVVIIVTLVALLFVAVECFDRYISTEKGTKYIYRKTPQAETLKVHFTKSGVRYITLGDEDKPNLLLIHGAPGGVMDWNKVAKDERIYEKYRLVIVERPGYGGTKPRKVNKSIKHQAERISEVLAVEGEATVLGHSYGGPIAVVLAALYPDLVTHVIGAAGQYSPSTEVVFPVSHYVKYPVFKFLLPRWLWTSNEEKLSHVEAQKEVLPLYKTITVPVTLLHGNVDTLVLYENSTFLMEELTTEQKELVTLDGITHPFHMQHPHLIVNFLINDKNFK